MGFYKVDCLKDISYMNSIMKPLTSILDKASNVNVVPVDILVDAGMSNIAQLTKLSAEQTIHTDDFPSIGDYTWKFDLLNHDISGWRAVLQKFDNFCKSARKDCMLVADGLRPMCLDGNVKIVRPTAP